MTIEGSAPLILLRPILLPCQWSEIPRQNDQGFITKRAFPTPRAAVVYLGVGNWSWSTLFLVPLRVKTNISEEHPRPFHMVNSKSTSTQIKYYLFLTNIYQIFLSCSRRRPVIYLPALTDENQWWAWTRWRWLWTWTRWQWLTRKVDTGQGPGKFPRGRETRPTDWGWTTEPWFEWWFE